MAREMLTVSEGLRTTCYALSRVVEAGRRYSIHLLRRTSAWFLRALAGCILQCFGRVEQAWTRQGDAV